MVAQISWRVTSGILDALTIRLLLIRFCHFLEVHRSQVELTNFCRFTL